MLERMSRARHLLRDRLLARAKRGEFATAKEISIAAAVPKQTAYRWVREAKLDLTASRATYLAKQYMECQAILAKQAGLPRLSGADRRRVFLETVKRFNESIGKKSHRTVGKPSEVGSA